MSFKIIGTAVALSAVTGLLALFTDFYGYGEDS